MKQTSTSHVKYVTHMGDDLLVVNAARASFAKEAQVLAESDHNLLRFLATGLTTAEREQIVEGLIAATTPQEVNKWLKLADKEKHFAPFTHPHITFRVSAPLCVARQLWKSHIGGYMTDGIKGDGWSEVSRRYVATEPEFYFPDFWRAKAENVKQGSSDAEASWIGTNGVKREMESMVSRYAWMIENGVAPEQARMVLPQNMMTEWVWTGSLLFFARVCKLRLDSHAQKETQECVKPIAEALQQYFPVSYAALMGEE